MAPIFELSVSSPTTDDRCQRVVESLARAGLDARVTPNVSVHFGRRENGCAVRIPGDPPDKKEHARKVWRAVRAAGTYDCAHLRIDGTYSGCVFNYVDGKDYCPVSKAATTPPPTPTPPTPPLRVASLATVHALS